jgi:hypothetical protein
MAKKSKTAMKSKTRKMTSKKALLVQGVGIFSSIPYTGTAIESAFKSGLGSITTVLGEG